MQTLSSRLRIATVLIGCLSLSLFPNTSSAFSLKATTNFPPPSQTQQRQQQQNHQSCRIRPTTALYDTTMSNTGGNTDTTTTTTTTTTGDTDDDRIVDRSTLTLLEHVNLNTPTQESILPFYFTVLGCGMDPRKASNLQSSDPKKQTLWANCGASQFHLPYGDTPQVIPNGKIGLRYNSLENVWERVQQAQSKQQQQNTAAVVVRHVSSTVDPVSGKLQSIELTDVHGNVFLCRAGGNPVADPTWIQPSCITKSPESMEKWGDEVVTQYGVSSEAATPTTDCRGIDFVEVSCPYGSAEKIALFYESVLDATTSVIVDVARSNQKVAMIAFGNVRQSGRADQSLLFRERPAAATPLPPYDGHHIAMYIGRSAADFEQAFRNAEQAGIVWVNPRFTDDALTLEGAQRWNQFRFKNIIDIQTGQVIMELEHEMRSVQHEAWPGGPIPPLV